MASACLVAPLQEFDSEADGGEERAEAPVVIDHLVVGGGMVSRAGSADLYRALVVGIGEVGVRDRDAQVAARAQERVAQGAAATPSAGVRCSQTCSQSNASIRRAPSSATHPSRRRKSRSSRCAGSQPGQR